MTTEKTEGGPLHLLVSTQGGGTGTEVKRGRGGNLNLIVGGPRPTDDTRDVVFTSYRAREKIEVLRIHGSGRIEVMGLFVGLDLATHRRLKRWISTVETKNITILPPTGNGGEAIVAPHPPHGTMVRGVSGDRWDPKDVSNIWGPGDGDPPGDLEFRDYSGLVMLKLSSDTLTWSGQLPGSAAVSELTPEGVLRHFAAWVEAAHLSAFGRMP